MSCCVLGQSPMELGSQQEAGVWHPGGVSKKTPDIICSSSRLPGKESGACVGLGDGETAAQITAPESASRVFPWEPDWGSGRCLRCTVELAARMGNLGPQAQEGSLCQGDNTRDRCVVFLQGHQPHSSEPRKRCHMCGSTLCWGRNGRLSQIPGGPASPD